VYVEEQAPWSAVRNAVYLTASRHLGSIPARIAAVSPTAKVTYYDVAGPDGQLALFETFTLHPEILEMGRTEDTSGFGVTRTAQRQVRCRRDVLRGDVDVGFDYYAALGPMVAGKQIKVIATSGDKLSPLFTGIPTVKDSGYPDYVVTSWNALSVRTATPAGIIAKLNGEIGAVLQMPEIGVQMAGLGMEPSASTPEAMTQRLKADADKWRMVIDKAGIPKQ
jgi:Tripartite tricarboxylate transporter family receptor